MRFDKKTCGAEPVALRAHHAVCICFFEGKGYSEEFVRHMTETAALLSGDPLVRVVASSDTLCSACPNNVGGVCSYSEKVLRYDREVLRLCCVEEGEVLPYFKLRKLVMQRILLPHRRSAVCADCEWDGVCTASAAKQGIRETLQIPPETL